MSKPLVIRPRAAVDVREQMRYLTESASLDVAIRFFNAFEAALERLRKFPQSGARWPTDNPELQGLRRLQMTIFPVSIFYRETETHVRIVRVLHGRRNLPSLLDEL